MHIDNKNMHIIKYSTIKMEMRRQIKNTINPITWIYFCQKMYKHEELKARVPRMIHQPVISHSQTLSH